MLAPLPTLLSSHPLWSKQGDRSSVALPNLREWRKNTSLGKVTHRARRPLGATRRGPFANRPHLRTVLDETVFDGHFGGCGTGRDAQLLVDRAEVPADGARAYVKLARDLTVREPLGDQPQDLDLAIT